MAFNLKRKKEAQLPLELGDVAYNPDNPFTLSWRAAVAKMLPQYQAQNSAITDINNAMATLGKTPQDVMLEAQAIQTDVLQTQQNAIDNTRAMEEELAAAAKSNNSKIIKKGNKMTKPFNSKKAQLPAVQPPPVAGQPPMDPMGLNDSSEIMGDNLQMQQDTGVRKFNDGADVRNWLTTEVRDMRQAQQYITENDDRTGMADTAKELVESFYTAIGKPGTTSAKLEKLAVNIFDSLPEPLKVKEETEGEIPAEFKSYGEIEEILKRLAYKTAQEHKKKKYNFKKTAQHKTLQNTILWGPGETRKVDPFLRQPVSDWHIIERNKGFGLVVDDVWNIDYETIWRENIMDKYSRPYKDKDGNWVGGYIQKRFEVDKNIPENSNLQLKPGQLRKPVIPEHGITESRLQAARSKGDIAGATDTSKPFNWKTVQAKKKS